MYNIIAIFVSIDDNIYSEFRTAFVLNCCNDFILHKPLQFSNLIYY